MPTRLERELAPCPKNNNVLCKLKAFEVWDNIWGGGIEDTTTAPAAPATNARRMISDGHDDDLGLRVRAVVIDGNADDDTNEKMGAIAKQENHAEIESEYLAMFGDAGGDGTATMDSMDGEENSEEEGIIPNSVNENYVMLSSRRFGRPVN